MATNITSILIISDKCHYSDGLLMIMIHYTGGNVLST